MAWFRQHQRATGIGLIASAVALLGIAAVLGWAMFTRGQPSTAGPGSSREPSASAVPSPSADASSTSEPSATPVPTSGFEAPAGILPPNSRARVTLDGLRIREQAGVTGAVLDTLPADSVVEVSGWWGPSVVDGIEWYAVVYHTDRFGYAAAGADGNRYLELLPPRCEEIEPDLATLKGITAWERLACFGNRSLTFTGTYGCPVCGAFEPGTYEPGWLASPENLNYLGWPDILTLHFAPEDGLDAPANGSIVRVTGHFNDPASATCMIGPPAGEPGPNVDPVMAELYCREQFVVDAYEIIGTDPDFTNPSGG